jgi:hypothetical protein
MRHRRYVVLWIIGLTIGWFEAAIVVDLRTLYYPNGFTFPMVVMPARLLGVEVAREACSLVLLAAIAWLAGQRRADRWGAFLLLFGIWDLFYYVVLKLVLDWPPGMDLGTWDILFLIPAPWAAPIWAPALVAAEFVGIGSYLYLTAERPRAYTALDTVSLVVGGLVIVGSFLVEWRTVVESRVPENFAVVPYTVGLLVANARFIACETRARRLGHASRPTATAPERG